MSRLNQLIRGFNQQVAAMPPQGYVLQASVIKRYLHRTARGVSKAYGPYYLWTRKIDNKTVTQALSAEQAQNHPSGHPAKLPTGATPGTIAPTVRANHSRPKPFGDKAKERIIASLSKRHSGQAPTILQVKEARKKRRITHRLPA
ncbi:MAG: hypothetical protein LAO31_19645 [Acidobacteriia bacterium]|nr:hypothetical protein [Terriglobia bacterium]